MKTLTLLSFVCFAFIADAQTNNTPGFSYKASFSAIIVKDVAASSRWYQSVFGVTVKDHVADEKNGYDIYILESPYLTLELLQLRGAVSKKDALAGKTDQTEVNGFFKIGFTVPDVDACLNHLRSLKIDVPQVYTDQKTKKKNFLITDPDGNLIQFFEQ